MLNYVSIQVADLERSGEFYDSLLSPLGWRRQIENEVSIGWGMVRAVFFVSSVGDPRPGFGTISFPTKAIPAVKASWESGMEHGGESEAQPGTAPSQTNHHYAARLLDPDGYKVEICVAND